MCKFHPPIIQSAIAGVADQKFCQHLLNQGGGLVTLGGFPADELNFNASLKMEARGRKEIIPPIFENNISEWFDKNLLLHIKNDTQKTAINLRIITVDHLTEKWLDYIDGKVDFLELNAHCRQKEVLEVGGGENLLTNLMNLDLLLSVLSSSLQKTRLSIKIRGCSVTNIDAFLEICEKHSINYIHIDAMLEGENSADIKLLENFCNSTSIPVIGNNSVRSIEDVKKMLEVGAIAVSVARPLIKNPNFITELIHQLEGAQ